MRLIAAHKFYVGFQNERLCFFLHALVNDKMVAAAALHMNGFVSRFHKVRPQGTEIRAVYNARLRQRVNGACVLLAKLAPVCKLEIGERCRRIEGQQSHVAATPIPDLTGQCTGFCALFAKGINESAVSFHLQL